MKLRGSSLVLTLVTISLVVSHGLAQSRRRFLSACNPPVSQEIFYTGVCSVRFPFTLLGKIAEMVQSAPDTQTLDSFLRERAFTGIGAFFRDSYGEPLPAGRCDAFEDGYEALTPFLDALQTEAIEFSRRLLQPSCLTNILAGEFSIPFYNSGFSELSITLNNWFRCVYQDWDDCGSGTIGFCPNTRDLFKIEYLDEITNRTTYDLLRNYANLIYTNYSLPSHLLGKNAFDQLLLKIDQFGTGATFMSDVKPFINSEFYEGIRGWYLNETASTTRKTTTTTTTTTTTRTTPTTMGIPVSDLVVYLVPSLVVFLGIIVTVVVIAALYSFRPVVIHVQPQPIVNGAGGNVNNMNGKKPEMIQMEKMSATKV